MSLANPTMAPSVVLTWARGLLDGPTLGTQLKLSANRPSGFDYLRTLLAISVVLWHTLIICYGVNAEIPFWTGWPRPLIFFIIPSFFALSGFLITGSAVRNSIPVFLTLRVMRIYPALFYEVIVSAVFLGPALSIYSYSEYFTHTYFYTYLLNSIGYVHYKLPGVFLNNPAGPSVNMQLWTVPFELECYLAITIIAILGVLRRPLLLGFVLCVLTLLSMGLDLTKLVAFSRPPGRLLVLSFLSGVFLYLLKEKIPGNFRVFIIAMFAAWVLLDHTETASLSALPVAYVTVWLGIRNPRRTVLVAGADYSYGIYLYGFPVQQALSYLLPQYRIWYINGALSVAITGALAYLSWNLIEQPIMKRKGAVISFLAAGTAQVMRFTPAWLAKKWRVT